MADQQTRRRRKRYQPGSAYAGDVRPRGVFRVFGNVKLFFLIGAAIMIGSLFVGGLIRSGALNGSSTNPTNNFVQPTDVPITGTPQAQPTAEIKHYAAPPAMTLDPSKHYTATIKTSVGDIQVDLLADQVPQTVNNFVFLAQGGFYNGLTFWQVVSGFDAQAGDPGCQIGQTSGSCRGSGDPGYQIPQEKPGSFDAGTIGMANASQFFIAFANDAKFAQYTPFGRITSGLDVAQQITQGTAIESITISAQ
jgi:cyclophilin family peptidyl-prolyl cis-trans isomerase